MDQALSPSEFVQVASDMMGNAVGMSRGTQEYRFRALFGVSPRICSLIWERVSQADGFPASSKPEHLLWSLLFVKVYATEPVNRVITGADEKTFRKWSWKFIDVMSNLDLIRWEARYENAVSVKCLLSVDGTDFRIYEPWPFNPKWYSHKFHGPGLRYEIGVSASSGQIVWANGPFPCGEFSDLKIFQSAMKKAFDPGEKVIADGGYNDNCCFKIGQDATETRYFSVVRARHETLNRRLKQFFVLGHRFRHSLARHAACFHAICNVTQLMIENGEPLFNISC